MRKNDAIGFPEEDAHCFLEKQSLKLRVKIIKIAWKLKDFSKSEHKINKICRIFCYNPCEGRLVSESCRCSIPNEYGVLRSVYPLKVYGNTCGFLIFSDGIQSLKL